METYKPSKGIGIYYMLALMLFYDFLFILGIIEVNSYIFSTLIKIALFIFTLYQLYYILIYYTLRYEVDDNSISIICFAKKVILSYDSIECYRVIGGNINGVKLSGFGLKSFALGKSVIKKIGTTNMFVTSSVNIVYIKTPDMNYALSPKNSEKFINALENKNILYSEWENPLNKQISLHKDKSFMIPFILASAIIVILTLNPFILYLTQKLPNTMPLNFDAAFLPVDQGTGKQFAFNQMIYGVLNMAILFCMYYASHFYAKYDKKSAKKYIYASLVIAVAFLVIQLRILYTFR